MGDRFSRQSFLGDDAERAISEAKIGVVGLGGGGSHVIQQMAHVGFRDFVVYDPDTIEGHNLNRLVGGTNIDAAMRMSKTMIAERLIRNVNYDAAVLRVESRWQDNPEPLRGCDLVFGCVDGYRERWELQVMSRRFVIPLIDIGLDVKIEGDESPRMAGQVIMSLPGGPCMRCLHFITDENLEREAAQYSDAGVRPQVVWANGVLASTAVGLAVDLLTGWTRSSPDAVYLSYDGNTGVVGPDKRLKYVQRPCPHFSVEEVGEPALRRQ